MWWASLRSLEGNKVPWFKSKGQETLTVRYTFLQLGNPTICVQVCVWLCDTRSRQGAHVHMQTKRSTNTQLPTYEPILA